MDEENKRSSAISPGLVSSMLKVLSSDTAYVSKVVEELKAYGDSGAQMAYLMGFIQGLKTGGRY